MTSEVGTPLRLAGFAAALVAVFALAFGAGRLGEEPADRTPSHAPATPEESHDHVD